MPKNKMAKLIMRVLSYKLNWIHSSLGHFWSRWILIRVEWKPENWNENIWINSDEHESLEPPLPTEPHLSEEAFLPPHLIKPALLCCFDPALTLREGSYLQKMPVNFIFHHNTFHWLKSQVPFCLRKTREESLPIKIVTISCLYLQKPGKYVW